MNVITAHSAQWSNADHTALTLTVDFEGLGEVPFGAIPDDSEAHGRDLYAAAVAGEFGPVAEYVPPPVTEADFSRAVQKTLDATAQQYGYDGILSACTYADDATVPLFQQQGQVFRVWRSQVWARCYATLAAVQAGTQAQPTIEALVASLPAVTVPTA